MNAVSNIDGWTVTIHEAISDIAPEDWDLCAGPTNPYVWHRHLLALEESGIVSTENGFTPRHILIRDAMGQAIAAAPAYLKEHSEGELGGDLGFAMAHGRAVGPYYPKLQVEVPMTPITGPRLLVREGVNETRSRSMLLETLKKLAEKENASSVQIAYMTAVDRDATNAAGFLQSEGNVYVWRQAGDKSFEDFLTRMNKRGRHRIRKERRKISEQNICFKRYCDKSVIPELAPLFFKLYQSTYDYNHTKIWHNKAYFEQLFRTMSENLELTIAYLGTEPVAAQLTFIAPDKLFGQHWGHDGTIRFLHFEQGLYQTIEYAIETGVEAVDFGTTGEHKAERGVGLEATYNAFWFREPEFNEVAEAGLKRKCDAAEIERTTGNARLPFHKAVHKENGI